MWNEMSNPAVLMRIGQRIKETRITQHITQGIDAVNRTCKGSIALRRTCFCIGLCHSHLEFLQHIVKAAFCDLVPFNRSCLGSRNDIADCGIHFLNHIRLQRQEQLVVQFVLLQERLEPEQVELGMTPSTRRAGSIWGKSFI